VPRERTEQQEHAEREAAAGLARGNVIAQLSASLLERAQVGSAASVAMRVLDLAQARRTGDADAIRAATFELALVAAEHCLAIDLAPPLRRDRVARAS
jgi:hypothetical protein